jgi:predicted amidophosphoribosyltransferase
METIFMTGKEMSTSEYNCLINENICPECRGELHPINGCKICYNCGFEPCS